MAFGLTAEGFTPKTLDDVKAEIENDLRSTFGEDIDLSPQTVWGQTVGIFAQKHSQLWALAFDIYANAYPDSASGASLDRICSLTGITRAPATASTATVIAYGIAGTSLPAGQEVRDSKGNFVYTTDAAAVITNTAARDVYIVVPTPATGDYTVTINGTAYTYNASGTPTINSIVNGLVAAISGIATPTNDDNKLRLTSASTSFSVTVSSNLVIDETGSPVAVTNTETGAVTVPIGAIDTIDTPVSGWTRVTSIAAGESGRDRETDEDLRLRRELSLDRNLVKALLEVENVTQARVFENSTDATDADGTPPQHIWAIVEGGDADEIAGALVLNAAGIGTRGTQQGIATSPYTGAQKVMRFDRPTNINPVIVITYSQTEEGTFPVDGVQLAKNALVAYGASLRIGDDLIYSRLFSPLHTVPGLQVDSLTVDGGTASLVVDKNELIVIRDADITMTVTP